MLSTKISRTTLADTPKRRPMPEQTPAMTRSLDGTHEGGHGAGPLLDALRQDLHCATIPPAIGRICWPAPGRMLRVGPGADPDQRGCGRLGNNAACRQAQDAIRRRTPTRLGLPLLHKGKVRELYALDDDRLLMVATDQISAFDFVLDTADPRQGRGSSPSCRCGGSTG